jgi:Fic family protein
MSEQASMNCYMMEERRALLESLGGLPETTVQNTEWLYMLREDTRQSLAIEGYFASEEQLEAVLQGNRTDLEILNYFRIAQTTYDLALQYSRDKAHPPLNPSVIRHVHSELFRASAMNNARGQFRVGPIQIRGARVSPPPSDIEVYVRSAIGAIERVLETYPLLPALARAHTLFESIHPFNDGNGRVGRILLNYLTIGRGYPPIVIKGMSNEERQRYYEALEAGDRGFHRGFPEPTAQALATRLEEGNFEPLCLLLCAGLLPRLDRMIAVAMETKEPLLELAGVAAQMGVKVGTLHLRIHRGRHIAVKRGKKLYSHPRLAL